jgi:tetratricopeptide (TPR) repeat protein
MDELSDNGANGGPGSLAPNDYVETDDYKALRKYYEASISLRIPPTDEKEAFRKLEEAIAIKPGEAIYRRLVAKMLLKEGDAATASEHLKRSLECVQSPNERAQANLLLGFAYDLQGRRDAAVDCYREALKIAESANDDILSCVNRFVIMDAEKYSKAPYTLENAKKLDIGLSITGKYDL